tara:strand:- start:3576 stop:4202 length:627 start_codon:yes stop_codon:yes gene_type:complete
MTENNNILLVFKSRNIILDILEERGYNTENYKGFSLNEITELVKNNTLDMLVESKDKKKVYIKYFNLDKSIRTNNIYEIIESLFNVEQVLGPDDELIIIIKDEPNDTLQKIQRSIYEHDKIFVNLINIDRLQFNILKHSLVPKHSVISEEEANNVRSKFCITNNSSFPTISRFDPVSQVLGIKPGQIFKIERSSKTAIKTKFYRICSA